MLMLASEIDSKMKNCTNRFGGGGGTIISGNNSKRAAHSVRNNNQQVLRHINNSNNKYRFFSQSVYGGALHPIIM